MSPWRFDEIFISNFNEATKRGAIIKNRYNSVWTWRFSIKKMSTPSTVQKVITAAQRTFQRSISNFVLNSEDFKESLVELKSILDSLRATDVGLDKSPILSQNPGQNQAKSGPNQASETPVTYIKIHEGKDVSIGIFLVKAGSRIPLHNHPKMYGLLKVLHGKVDVSIYTKTQKSQENIPQILVDKKHFIDQGFVFPTKKELLKSVTDEHEALVLTPGKQKSECVLCLTFMKNAPKIRENSEKPLFLAPKS